MNIVSIQWKVELHQVSKGVYEKVSNEVHGVVYDNLFWALLTPF